MGFKLKLSEEAPEQHVAILALAGVMILISVITSLGGSSSENAKEQQRGTFLETGEPLHKNPQLTWYEKYLCRGYTRSLFCRYRIIHPLMEDYDIQAQEAPPVSKDKVIHYRGPLPHNRSFSEKIVLDNYY